MNLLMAEMLVSKVILYGCFIYLGMDFDDFDYIVLKSFDQDCYTKIVYNGMVRNVYPFSFRNETGGMRMYAWCEIHASEPIESFYVDLISTATVGDPIYYEPLYRSELSNRSTTESGVSVADETPTVATESSDDVDES
jgi:hypothetical protein